MKHRIIESSRKPARRRRRGAARIFVLGATFVAAHLGGVAITDAAPPQAGAAAATTQGSTPSGVVRFDIPPGSLSAVIAAFERASGLRIVFADPALGTIPSMGVSGAFTPAQALDRLLAGTSVRATLAGLVATLDVDRVNEFVAVTGQVPSASSPKYTEPIRDTPQTIVVIPQSVVEAQGATSLRDALRNTPGITLTAGEGGTAPGDNLLIRGFNARNDVYVDGARDTGVVSRDTFNTEAVEVAKGPSSVVTGRGATGGSVNLVTKSAGLSDVGSLRLTGGSADNRRVTADVNRRLARTTGLRLNMMWQDSGVPGRDAVVQKAWGFAPSLTLGAGTPTQITANYQHLQQNNVPDYGLPNGLPDAAVSAGITVKDLDFSNFYGLASRDHEKMRADVGTVTVEHRFTPAFSLRNLVRYGRNDLDRVVTAPRAATVANAGGDPGFDPSVPQIRRTDTKYQYRTDSALTNQTDASVAFATGPLRHDLAAGMELSHESQPSHGVADTFANGRPPVTSLFDPRPTDAYVPSLAPTGASTDATSVTTALYVFDTIKPGDRWQVDLGLRWDRIAVDYATVETSGARAAYARTDKAASGRAGLVFKPAERGSLYAAYTTSFNPSFDGSFGLTLADRSGSLEDLPPERTHNVEVGTKWDLPGGSAITAALFRTEKTNAKTTDESGAPTLLGDQQVTGVEVGISGNLTERLAVFSGLSVMDATVRESGVAGEVGRQLAYVPKTAFNLWSTYRVPVVDLTIGGGAQFTDGYFFSNTNALATDNAAAIHDLTRYWLFNAMASYPLTRHLTLQVNGTNLANARYVERGYGGHFIPGPGRAILLSPIVTF